MARNTIKLKKYQDIIIERLAGGAITPGHLLQLGSANTVVVHATQAGNVTPKMFALGAELKGDEISDAYASGELVFVWVAQPGEVVYAILADGDSVSIGDPVESAGDGTLQSVALDSTGVYYTEHIVGIAYEALDLTGSSGEEPTMHVPIMIV